MNKFYPHPIIAKEGWPFIVLAVVVSIIVSFFSGFLAILCWLVTLFVIQFFRDPSRVIPEQDNIVVCPADGRIVVVEKTVDPFRQREALKISVFMNVFNVHSNRCPLEGTVQKVAYFAGSFLNAALDKASEQNERNAVLLKTADGQEITFVQVAGLVARRILCYTKAGDALMRGERYGFIRFGSRVDVYLPTDAIPKVAIGDKVRATETILACLSEQNGE